MNIELQSFEEWAQANANFDRSNFEKTESTDEPQDSLSQFNNWSIEEWCKVSGIGVTLAQRLVESAPFNTIDDVKAVKGINNKLANTIQELVV